MRLDFDTKVDREGLATIRELNTPKHVTDAGLTSLWGAEFEFPMPEFIIDAIKNWIDHGMVAYSYADEAYYECIKFWMKYHRNWEIETDWIVPTYGHSHSVGTICRAFTKPGDGIIGMNPVYHNTWRPVQLNDRIHVDCPLLLDGDNYTIDYRMLERLMAVPENKVLVFCNPHNPIAKVWGREDLQRIADLALKYNVIIYSDEIFADTVYDDVEMLTFDQVTEKPVKWIAGTSLGKTFSMTGIGQANMIIRDKELREAFEKQKEIDHYGSLNPLMRIAYLAGYTEEGSLWVKEMMKYCYDNYVYIDSYFRANITQLKAIKPEGSYILWVDCRELGLPSDEDYEEFFEAAGLICDVGTTYGSEPGFIRINLALPRKELELVCMSLKTYIKEFE